jgi:flagellar basal body rod protein FlgF
MTSYSKFADDIKRNLEMQLKNIEACDKETEKLNKD